MSWTTLKAPRFRNWSRWVFFRINFAHVKTTKMLASVCRCDILQISIALMHIWLCKFALTKSDLHIKQLEKLKREAIIWRLVDVSKDRQRRAQEFRLATLKNHFHFLVPRKRKSFFIRFPFARLPDCQGRDFLFQSRRRGNSSVSWYERSRKTVRGKLERQKARKLSRVNCKKRCYNFCGIALELIWEWVERASQRCLI